MKNISDILKPLADKHRIGLNWFINHKGTEQPWTPSIDDVLLVTKAKGIYKPNWMEYALSVRQVLNSPYPDRDPIFRPDGTWIYQYFQEGDNPNERDQFYTNRALMACWRDQIPVGVMRQTSGKPFVRYHILGVALVSGWENGHFFLEGFSTHGQTHGRGAQAQIDILVKETEIAEAGLDRFEPVNLVDARQRIISSIVRRQGQRQFRVSLLEAYSGRCALSDCNVSEALEAVHIVPYLGPETNKVNNGLLLRADIHTLFDLGKIAIEAETMTVIVSEELFETPYQDMAGKRLNLPADKSKWPSIEALNYHRNWAGI